MNSKKRVLSLFSGCGGMDLGFEGSFKVFKQSVNTSIHPDWIKKDLSNGLVELQPTGFETVFANDIRLGAKIAWERFFNKRHNNGKFYQQSIIDLVKAHKKGEFKFPSNIDVITGGFPCQDFSLAGKRKGFNSQKNHNNSIISYDEPSVESRGMLYYWMREVIDIVRPKIFIAENVKGLLTLGDAREIIQKDFASIGDNGYLVISAKLLNASDYGVPQNRERVFFLGFSKKHLNNKIIQHIEDMQSDLYPFPEITHSNDKKTNILSPKVTAADYFRNLLEPDLSQDLAQKNYSKAKWMGKHCQGQSEVKLNAQAPTIRSEHHGNIEFRRLSLEHGGLNIKELKSGLKERRLSVRECARIQTFPDDYEFVFNDDATRLSASEAYKLIGNAVPPFLAYNLAKKLESLWPFIFNESRSK